MRQINSFIKFVDDVQIADFDGSYTLAIRMQGNPEPSNNALGAVLMDSHQLAFLKHLLDTLDNPALREDYRESLNYYRDLFGYMADFVDRIEFNHID